MAVLGQGEQGFNCQYELDFYYAVYMKHGNEIIKAYEGSHEKKRNILPRQD